MDIGMPTTKRGSIWVVSVCYARPPHVHVQPWVRGVKTKGTHPVRFRTLTARAAARRYIRNNLVTALYLMDDGGNQPEDLRDPNGRNRRNPRKYMQNEKRTARRLGSPLIIIDK